MSALNQPAGACGCGEDVSASTPLSIANIAGRSSLDYRVGTHGSFKATMRAALARQAGLADLTTRKDDDPSIALLDAWSTVLDVLTFYQERIANEGYIRTAIDQRSVLELARAIGYELNPGVAASAFLAFTVDDAAGSPPAVALEAGTKVQSVPGQDELPQIFETTETIEARAAWNVLKPRAAERVYPATGSTTVYLQGTSTNLRPGDGLLIVGDERTADPASSRWDFRKVQTITVVPPSMPTLAVSAGLTIVELDRDVGAGKREAPRVKPKIYAFRQRAALFGYNAPDWRVMSRAIKRAYGGDPASNEWPRFNIAYKASAPETVDRLYLEAVYPAISHGSWLMVTLEGSEELYSVRTVSESSRSDFGLTAKTTVLDLDGALSKPYIDSLRDIVVFAASELMEWADTPIADPVSGAAITLDAQVDGLTSGHLLMASGSDAVTGEPRSEAVTLARTNMRGGLTELVFTTALQHPYRRDTLTIHGNVARATHGETRTEILGSGDGSRTFQKFLLKQSPLTYVSAATPSGSQTTLEVRVNDILWEEVPSLYGTGPADRVYVTRLADDGTVTVEFGDGITGARLPTGAENVVAVYRVGSGIAGLVDPDQISLLMSRPLGLKSGTNPSSSSGAEDREALEQARTNSPLTVLTMERIVSLQDCENFARAFAGVAKAQATLLWNGEGQMVHITVAGADGIAIEPASELYGNLRAAIDTARHANHAIQIDSYVPLLFDIKGKLLVDERYIAEAVMADVKAALEKAFSFEQRAFAQPVTKSDVLSVMQSVEGVVAVDLDSLYPSGEPARLSSVLPASRARWDLDVVVPAELLIVNPAGVVLTEMSR